MRNFLYDYIIFLLVLITSIEVTKTENNFLKILGRYLNNIFFNYNFKT